MKEIPADVYSEIKNAYLDQVETPEQKPENQYLLCPIGLVGSGKTTVLTPLAKKLNLVRLSHDDIRKLLHERGYGYEASEQFINEIVEEFLAKGFSVALDADCIRGEVQKKIADRKNRYNLQVFWIHINPPEQFILEKLGRHKTSWLGTAEQVIKNYFVRKSLHANLNFPFIYTFDPSRPDLEKQINEATTVISSKIQRFGARL